MRGNTELKDYYAILGVKSDASEDTLRHAYRKLARLYHPDVNTASDAEARMCALNEAYDVLRDAEKRAAYDAALTAESTGNDDLSTSSSCAHPVKFAQQNSGHGTHKFSRLVATLLRSKRWRRDRQDFYPSGEDHHVRIEVALEDTLQGATREFRLRSLQRDSTGETRLQERKITVLIPAGVHAGQHICLKGQGNPGCIGAAPGDLYLEVCFKPHRFYHVKGRDLVLTLPISPWEAALGAIVQAPTLAGPVAVSIPPGSGNGCKLRLKERGLTGNPPGDLYLILEVALPPAKTETTQQAYRHLARQAASFDPRAHLKSIS